MLVQKKKILAICGSTRHNSINKSLLKAIARLYNEKVDVHIYDQLAGLPHFNPDLDNEDLPQSVKAFRNDIEVADGVLICTPEYVFSLPGSLKNALEWTVSTTLFSEKPAALIVASGLGEQAYASLLFIMKTLQASIGENAALLIQGAKSKINQQEEIVDELTLRQIAILMTSFIDTINQQAN